MSKVSNEQLRVILTVPTHKLKAVKTENGFNLIVSAGADVFHPLATERGSVREFKTFDAIVNHVSKIASGSFKIEFGGDHEQL